MKRSDDDWKLCKSEWMLCVAKPAMKSSSLCLRRQGRHQDGQPRRLGDGRGPLSLHFWMTTGLYRACLHLVLAMDFLPSDARLLNDDGIECYEERTCIGCTTATTPSSQFKPQERPSLRRPGGSLVWNYDEVWLYNLRDQKELVWNVQGLDDRRARQRARNWEVGA